MQTWSPIYDRLHLYTLIGIIVTAVCFLVAFLLARHLQKGISRPILQLAETARLISERRDYNVRAEKFNDDELGLLTDAFNHMLGQIKERELALEQNAQRLRLALQAAQIGTWDWHIQIDRVDWDDLVYRHFGSGNRPGRAHLRALPARDRSRRPRPTSTARSPRRWNAARSSMPNSGSFWPDGSVHYLVTRGKALYDDNGRAVRISGVSLDITERRQAEQAQAFIAAIVESSDDAIIGKDFQSKIVSWNLGAERMFGYLKQEIVGHSVQILTSPDRPTEEEQILAKIRAGSPVEHYETVRMRKDGQPVQVALSVSPIRNAKGTVIGISSTARNITEKKKAEEVLTQQAAVLREQAELLDLANVLARNLNDRIILWSAGTEQMYGWSRAEALGRNSHELLGTEFSEPYPKIIDAVLREGEWTGELVHRRRNGQTIIVASHWVLYKDDRGQPTAILEVNNDITERKGAEEEVRRLNAELEQRVRERTAELTETNRDLEAFTYSVSHDLRAPLRHVDAFARIVEEESAAEAGPELRSYIARIRKGTATMGRLVDDLLNLSRVGRAQLGSPLH